MLKSYSYSALETFGQCPRKFKFEKIERIQTVERVAAHIYLGEVIHRALARLYEAAAQGKLLELNDLLAVYDADWDKPARSGIVCMDESFTVDDYILSGREMLTRYYSKYQPFGGGTLLGVERQIPFTLDGTPFRFNARIDRLWKRPDGVVEIWDYKTGRELPRKTDLRFRLQMGLYHLAVKQNWPQFERLMVAVHALRQDEIISDMMSDDEVDEIAERFKVEIFETLAAERTDNYPTREGHHCRWCDYLALCPAKIHKRFIEGEESDLSGDKSITATMAAELADRYRAANDKYQAAKRDRDQLNAEIVEAARELGVSKLAGSSGEVSVKLAMVEEFPTRTGDPTSFANLLALARDAGLETVLTLDARELKKLYDQHRLPEELMKRLESFILRKENHRVSVPRGRKGTDDEDDSE